MLAVWDEVEYAEHPIVSVSQLLDCGVEGPAKIDVVSKGGEVWVKVNT